MKTELAVILDRSGSMASCKSDVEGGFDSLMAEQKALAEPGECFVTLTQFDSEGIELVYERKPLADVPSLKLEPRGNTPLLDAVGTTIAKLAEALSALAPDDDPRVLVVILTDGQENASKEWTKQKVRDLIEGKQKAGWEFMYLGAHPEAFHEAGGMGIAIGTTVSSAPTASGYASTFAVASAKLSDYRRSGKLGAFTEEERKKMADEPDEPKDAA